MTTVLAGLSILSFSACRPKEGKGYTPPDPEKAVVSQPANGAGGAAGEGTQGGASTSGGGASAAPPAVRNLEPPKKDDPEQGQPEKSALPKNLEQPK